MLKNNERTFDFEVKGNVTHEVYKGQFTVKCLLQNDEMIEIYKLVDRYNGGSYTLHSGASNFNRALAELEVRLVAADAKGNSLLPKWFSDSNYGRKLLNPNVVIELYEKALAEIVEYRKELGLLVEKAEEEAVPEAKKPA
jgi:hypothetical protein